MRLNTNLGSVRVGNVEVHDLFRVTELDAGHFLDTNKSHDYKGGDLNSTTSNRNIPLALISASSYWTGKHRYNTLRRRP